MDTPKLKESILIYAPTVTSQGGITLIQSFLDQNSSDFLFILNSEIVVEEGNNNILYAQKGFVGILTLEYNLPKIARPYKQVLSMANRPPLRKIGCTVFTLIMSTFVVEPVSTIKASRIRKIKSFLQQKLNLILRGNTNYFITRSKSTSDKLAKITKTKTLAYPFMPNKTVYRRSYSKRLNPTNSNKLKQRLTSEKKIVLFYPADYQPHKNHENLLAGWKLVFQKQKGLSLQLTITAEQVSKIMPDYLDYGVQPLGAIKRLEMQEKYRSVDAIIYPSYTESLALVLVEACQFEIPIIASELDYVREVVDPEESFDPNSAYSIAAAIIRFSSENENKVYINDAGEFLEYIDSLPN